mgnify:CR=1 FL=1
MAIFPNLSASIVIPSLGRSDCLQRCVRSIGEQICSIKPEILILTEEGPLAEIRNRGLRRAKGDIVIFIDDDVVCPAYWLNGILSTFTSERVVGVSGPAVIPKENQAKRDMFKWPLLTYLYSLLFIEPELRDKPGHISQAGAWSMGAIREDCLYSGEVQFLEACNMSFRRTAIMAAKGFDEAYVGIGDWSEPDLSFRIRQAGGHLLFTPRARLYHYPSQTGAYKKRRADSPRRLANYELFANRWVSPHPRHTLYRNFLRLYYWGKERGLI